MNPARIRLVAYSVFVLLPFLPGGSYAQAPLEAPQMPSRTLFYVIWRGSPPPEVRKANSLLALWDDPDLAPLRAALFSDLRSGSDDNSKSGLTREETEQFATLAENPFVLGYLPRPGGKNSGTTSIGKPAERSWNGMFFVYDQTGKETLLAKAVLRLRSREKDPPKLTPMMIGNTPVLKVERKTGVTYWAQRGKYAVSAGEAPVFEEIVAHLDGRTGAANSLAESAAYQEARPVCGGGLLEFFVRIPQLKDFAAETSGAAFKPAPILDALRLDAVHSLCGHMTLEGAKTRLQGAVLGEAQPGTLFDLWADGQRSPASLSMLPSDAVSYSETQINLSAMYEIIKRGVRTVLPSTQQNGLDMMEGMAATRLGMPLAEALNLLTGEFASIQAGATLDPQTGVYFLGIRQKPETLKLLRSLFGDRVASERNVGEVTFVKISLSGKQNATGVAQWNFYNLAVTPSFVLASQRAETLREFLTRATQAGNSQGLPPSYRSVRAQFPDALNGVGFLDFQKVDWQAMKARWIEEARKTSAKKAAVAGAPETNSNVPEWLETINPQVIPRHLHFLAGASWKDAKGLHFDEWLD
jgi:hypothetical protein